ncbi:MAG: nickel pincer cofactor biosynthesis protein LarB [Candidatus Omnitrophica bacterium]|nr:nickel pincer cofactor biosynthesis protein LarB [Candidatus Omnitrophota bacterium]
MPSLRQVLSQYKAGRVSRAQVLDFLNELPYKNLRFAKVDTHRLLRRRSPEVIYAKGKSVQQIVRIASVLHEAGQPVFITKLTPAAARQICRRLEWLSYHPQAQVATNGVSARAGAKSKKKVLVVTAGTSDLPVAEEAMATLRWMGCAAQGIFDVGVAGLHRILAQRGTLRRAAVIIVIAGMDGALPSVISGLVKCPVVAVPTSTGYGASFKGVAPLLTMLNSCSPGVSVVNIDNGFGAGYLAALIAGG